MASTLHSSTIKVVYNAYAGNSKFLSQDEIGAYLGNQGIPYEWITVEDLKFLAQKSLQHHYILILGGDGTLHAILNAIGYRNIQRFTFGIIPMGTGNDFARSLDIPLSFEKAFQTLSEGYISTVDLGVMNQRICFTCALSLGFGTEVTKSATRGMKSLLGRWALYLGALLYLVRPKPIHKLRVRINDEAERRLKTLQLVIGNAKTHGGGFTISPTAHLQNSQLDLYYIKPVRFFNLARLFYKAFKHNDHTGLEEVTYRQIDEIRIALSEPLDVDVDGDIYTFYKNINVKVYPGQLNVIMPKSAVLDGKLIKDSPWKFVSTDSRAS